MRMVRKPVKADLGKFQSFDKKGRPIAAEINSVKCWFRSGIYCKIPHLNSQPKCDHDKNRDGCQFGYDMLGWIELPEKDKTSRFSQYVGMEELMMYETL